MMNGEKQLGNNRYETLRESFILLGKDSSYLNDDVNSLIENVS